MALKTLAAGMYDLISDMIECTDLLYAGLINNKLTVVKEAASTLGQMVDKTEAMTEELIAARKADPSLSPYVSVPSHIGRMVGNMSKLTELLEKKVAEGVLFSDRAVTEIEYLFERVRDILVHTKDIVLARNTLISRHIEESEKAVERSADEYSTRHEERLIEGLCTPRASGLYLEMLDALKVIAWHSREIAKDLG